MGKIALRNLFKELFGETEDIEGFDIETKSKFTEAILENVFVDLQEDQQGKAPKFQKLQIKAQWNPPQVVEIEPPPEPDGAIRQQRKVSVTPLRR